MEDSLEVEVERSTVDQREGGSETQGPQGQDALEVFREEWREELRLKNQPKQGPPSSSTATSIEEEAMSLYWMGAAAEKSGDMQSALLYYRRACHLVPDIDFKLVREQPPHEQDSEEEDELSECSDMADQLQTLSIQPQCPDWCLPNRPTKSVHISSLPLDVVRHIVRWVVSAQLDMRSLEMLSLVCKSLYCLARDPQLWRMACRRLWKDATGPTNYGGSWRRMFILKPHLLFNGVYIGKTTYVREGERSLDSFYKPFHTVVYYRFLRFFPDGCVMYQTSPLDPAACVPKLCHRHSSESVLLGTYTHTGNNVVVEVSQVLGVSPTRPRGRGKAERQQSSYERVFHLELALSNSSRRRRYNQLSWREFSCQTVYKSTGHVQNSEFSLDYTYSPFYFSRVKSYTTNSLGLLS